MRPDAPSGRYVGANCPASILLALLHRMTLCSNATLDQRSVAKALADDPGERETHRSEDQRASILSTFLAFPCMSASAAASLDQASPTAPLSTISPSTPRPRLDPSSTTSYPIKVAPRDNVKSQGSVSNAEPARGPSISRVRRHRIDPRRAIHLLSLYTTRCAAAPSPRTPLFYPFLHPRRTRSISAKPLLDFFDPQH